MNIKEIEHQSEMPRATIKYYEKEGIISPERKENGYRDYSEEDLKMLQKVKLLRMLDVSLEEIVNLQNGTVTLDKILEEQIKHLQNEEKNYVKKKEICARMQSEGYSFKTLNATKYLEMVYNNSAEENSEPSAYEQDKLPYVNYPIRRFVARAIDLYVYSLLWRFISICIFHIPAAGGILRLFVDMYITYGIMLVLEPLLLHLFGMTLGKIIFGLKVLGYDGKKLSVKEGYRRTIKVFAYGMAYGIPFVNLWFFYKSYNTCVAKEDLEWEYNCTYSIKDTFKLRILVALIVFYVFSLVGNVLDKQERMPVNRGEINRKELSENINRLKMYYPAFDYIEMGTGGSWYTPEEPGGGMWFTYDEFGEMTKYPYIKITEENDAITAVEFTVEKENLTKAMTTCWEELMDLLILSFAATDKSVSCLEVYGGDYLYYDGAFDLFEDFSFNLGKYNVSCTYEYNGFEEKYGVLIPTEEENHFLMKFEIAEKE